MAVLDLFTPVRPNADARSLHPVLSPLTLPQLCMLFQSTHEELQGAEALAEQGERIFKSPLKRTLSAQIMVGPSTMGLWIRETILFIRKPIGRSIMISNATNPLKESRKNLY